MVKQHIVQQAFAEYLSHVTPDTFAFETRLFRRTLDRLTATPATIEAPAIPTRVQVVPVVAAPVAQTPAVDPNLATFDQSSTALLANFGQTRDARRSLARIVNDDAQLCFAFAPGGAWTITTNEPRIAVRAVNLDDAMAIFRTRWSATQANAQPTARPVMPWKAQSEAREIAALWETGVAA